MTDFATDETLDINVCRDAFETADWSSGDLTDGITNIETRIKALEGMTEVEIAYLDALEFEIPEEDLDKYLLGQEAATNKWKVLFNYASSLFGRAPGTGIVDKMAQEGVVTTAEAESYDPVALCDDLFLGG